ncbi:MnhE [Desulfamplus magnetovallimortis]|uniref:MnhE n=1 Tax=Desulfamplus magnetovallimortis TaxID=1246637 RepID=A0A1W1H8Y0_9BACT|nr:Na+/H+ antiporter subunit E [Desulfamplus magnetovallimortis]SLM28931.1 MnhE [Desulfamplus magnetovallimortis]
MKTKLKKAAFVTTFSITFLILFLFWCIFSGKFDAFHLSLGVISCLLICWATSSDLLIVPPQISRLVRLWSGFVIYIPWLIWQIILANIHVLVLVLSPDMDKRINPKIIKFKSRIKDTVGLVTFANSITLTPGTITVALNMYGDMVIHAIDDESAAALPGDMEKKVAKLFGE